MGKVKAATAPDHLTLDLFAAEGNALAAPVGGREVL